VIHYLVEGIYILSLLVIIYFCILAVVRKDIWIGKTGSLLLGGMAISAVKMFEFPPRPSLVMMVSCMAALCILAYHRWLKHKHEFDTGKREDATF